MLDGASFVHKADAENGNGNGNPDINSITVIDSASASEPASASASKDNCPSPRYGGNITGDHSDVGVPNFSDLRFLADQDLLVHANFDAGTNAEDPAAGTSIGGEEIELFMSSSMLAGSVLAAKAPTIPVRYPGARTSCSDSPFSSVISTALWREC